MTTLLTALACVVVGYLLFYAKSPKQLLKKLFPPRHICKFDGRVEYIYGTKFVHCSHPGCNVMDEPGLQDWLDNLPHAKALRRYKLQEIFWKHYETWTHEEQSSFWREQRECEHIESRNDFVYRKAQEFLKKRADVHGPLKRQ